MAFSLTWLPDVLKRAGLKVALVPGWENRGRGNVGRIFGVICHHTAGLKQGNMPSLQTLIIGRSDLPGPLAQLGLARDGTYYVIAAGRANHAGRGVWKGVRNGNSNFIGIEAESTGKAADRDWTEVQIKAYIHGVAAILKHIRQKEDFCAGHKEYAPNRKPDPVNIDMDDFRAEVAKILNGNGAPLGLIPSSEPSSVRTIGRPTLRRGMIGPLTKLVQQKIRVTTDGIFGPKTEAVVRQFQRENGLVPDGIVGPKTWKVFDNTL